MNENERSTEFNHLERTIKLIQFQIKTNTGSTEVSQAELQEALTNYWEGNRTDFWEEAQLIEMVDRQRNISSAVHERQLQLKRLVESPYFGRIDFIESQLETRQPAELIYIGIATFTDQHTGEILIYDWRSPVAGMFYDFERGSAYYECPIGEIQGTITLKRQYKINNGRIIYMFDSDLKIDDEFLQELLGRSADDKMRTIVNSIQREQNKVIRDESHQVLLVQGPAGSGKTSIALHRAAYLLYRERNSLTARNILIFSPNRFFSDYISNVLPEMGEENVLQTTFRDYISRIVSRFPLEIEDWNSQLEYLFTNPDDKNKIASISYKTSPEFSVILHNYLTYLTETVIKEYPDIVFRGTTIFTRENWQHLFFDDLAYLPVEGRLAQIRRFIEAKLQPLIHQLRREKETEITNRGEEVNEKTIKAMARLSAREELHAVYTQLDQLTTLDPFKLYRRLFEDHTLFQDLATEYKIPTEWPVICEQTLAQFEHGKIFYEDLLPLLYVTGILTGFPTKSQIRHLIIDEAQDYTILQYEIFKYLFPKASWTILGDPAQSIHPYLHRADFRTVASILGTDHSLIIELDRSYRSTKEIQSFSAALLPEAKPVNHINRSGPRPEVLEVEAATHPTIIATKIHELYAEGWKSVAVICKTTQEAGQLFLALENLTEVVLITDEDTEFQRGSIIIPSYLAKGLEFDAVLVHDVSATIYNCEAERNVLYTICTRALHRLTLYYVQELSPFITSLNKELYLTKETAPKR